MAIKTRNKKLVIVSGATGDLGRLYLDHYSGLYDSKCIGLARKEETRPIPTVDYLKADLTEPIMTEEQIKKISLGEAKEILLIHPVGGFKFEGNGLPELDNDNDGIDDEVKISNINTFHNVVGPLLRQRKGDKCPLTLVAFGSLSDIHNVPWWKSYSRSKLMLREEIRDLTRTEPDVKGIFFNLSSVKTKKETQLRPFADDSFWLSPKEVVNKSISFIESLQTRYLEIDIFKPWPEYHKNYYKEFDALRSEWLVSMGKG